MARNYMMRSEKRERTVQPAHAESRPRPRKRRRRGAGFVYKFFMMLLLLVLWPFGLLMLWRRKVRWSGGMKLLVSIVTLAACVLIYGFALTVNTGNAQYTAIQDTANNYLDISADWLVNAGHFVADKSVEVWDGVTNLSDAAMRRGAEVLPDALDKGVEIAGDAKAGFVKLANKVGWKLEIPEAEPEITPEPEATIAPETPAAESGNKLSPSEKAEKVRANLSDSRLPIYVPSAVPDPASGKPLTAGKLVRGLPTPTPAPTPEPTPEPTDEPEAESSEAPEAEAQPSEAPEAETEVQPSEAPETDNVG